MAKNHPKGLIVLALANMGERFGYYTMLAILTLYMQAKFGFSSADTSMIYGTFLALVYFLPVFGGMIADKWLGYGKTIFIGILIMFGGYLLLGMPFGSGTEGKIIMFLSLVLISAGTGLFKGNLQALVGKLYDNPLYSKNRDMAFSIFYMFINIGAFFAPSMGNYITQQILGQEGFTYDAAIPANYVKLNDEVVNKDAFVAEFFANDAKYAAATPADQDKMIAKKKKSKGVIFEEEFRNVMFNLRLAGLRQYTKANKITDPAIMVSEADYELMASRNPDDKIAQDAIRERITTAQVPTTLAPGDQDFERNFGSHYVGATLSKSYSWAFFVACISLVISILIFFFFRSTWKPADVTASQMKAKAAAGHAEIAPMGKEEVKERLIALALVFAVVIFFWMSFHQNGLTMTFFARDYTQSKVGAGQFMAFSLFMLIPFICFMYGVYLSTFGLLGGKKNPKTGLLLVVLGIIGLVGGYFIDIKPITELMPAVKNITPQIFQQFNPFFIILLTPVTVGLFGYLAGKGKEPSAPRKIGIGMVLASLGFLVLLVGSIGLPAPSTLDGPSSMLVTPNLLIGTYFVLTIAELFLSPMGLSFVSKVAPPQYAGLMQGGWLAATAVGNLLVGVMGSFWDKMPLVAFWGVLIACCLLSAIFIFSVMKKLERVTA